MLDAVTDYAIFMLDTEGMVVTWSRGAELLTGFSAAAVLGKSFETFYGDDDKRCALPREQLRAARMDGRFEEEGWRVRRDGTRFWASVIITAAHDSNGQHVGFTNVTRDCTERKRADEQLQRSEERFRLLVENVRDYAIFMLDPDGTIASWNRGAQRIKGYRADEIIGKHFSIFYSEEARRIDHPAEELRRALADGAYEEEGWRFRKDGSRFWASVVITAVRDAQGRHLGFAKVTRDLSGRRAAEERLRQSEERLRLLVESVKDYAIYMLDPDGRIATWNKGAETIKGYRADEIIGQNFRVFYRPEDADAGFPERELRIAAEEGRYEEIGWRVRKNGELFCANVVLTAVYDDGRNLRGFAKVTRDLTEWRRVEGERREAERKAAEERARTEQAELAIKMRDEFLSIAAHELRTPLAALKLKLQGATRLVRQPASSSSTVGDRIEAAGRHVERLGQLIERLLDVSRIVSGRFELRSEPFNLAATVREVVEDFSEQSQLAGCKVTIDSAETVMVTADRQRVEQVLINLFTNAIKYGAGKPIVVHVAAGENRIRVSIRDNGIGIASDDLDRIFGRFERAVSATHYGGLGLGLYITRHIVESHGGRIFVESELGKGSEFVVELPNESSATAPDGRSS